jgi:hypothetical protein
MFRSLRLKIGHILIGWGLKLLNSCRSTPGVPYPEAGIDEINEMMQSIESDPRPIEEIVEGSSGAALQMPAPALPPQPILTPITESLSRRITDLSQTVSNIFSQMDANTARHLSEMRDEINRLRAEVNNDTQRREVLQQVRDRARVVRTSADAVRDSEAMTLGALSSRHGPQTVPGMSPMAQAVQEAVTATQIARSASESENERQLDRVRAMIEAANDTSRVRQATPISTLGEAINAYGETEVRIRANTNRGSEFIASDFHVGSVTERHPTVTREPAPNVRHETGDRNLDQTI